MRSPNLIVINMGFSHHPRLRVVVEYERKAESKNTATKKRTGTKARDLLKKYPKEKAESLMARLKSRKLYYFDPDFPEDWEDCPTVCKQNSIDHTCRLSFGDTLYMSYLMIYICVCVCIIPNMIYQADPKSSRRNSLRFAGGVLLRQRRCGDQERSFHIRRHVSQSFGEGEQGANRKFD